MARTIIPRENVLSAAAGSAHATECGSCQRVGGAGLTIECRNDLYAAARGRLLVEAAAAALVAAHPAAVVAPYEGRSAGDTAAAVTVALDGVSLLLRAHRSFVDFHYGTSLRLRLEAWPPAANQPRPVSVGERDSDGSFNVAAVVARVPAYLAAVRAAAAVTRQVQERNAAFDALRDQLLLEAPAPWRELVGVRVQDRPRWVEPTGWTPTLSVDLSLVALSPAAAARVLAALATAEPDPDPRRGAAS